MKYLIAAMVFVPAVAMAEAHGFTFEGGFGGGAVRTGGESHRFDSITYGGSLAAGTWLTPRLAVTARLTLQHYKWVSGDDSTDYRYWFLGPSAQYLVNDWLWASAGAGLALYQTAIESSDHHSSWFGVGADARLGVSPPQIDSAIHKLSAWLEVQPAVYYYDARFLSDAELRTFVSITFNLGYQLR